MTMVQHVDFRFIVGFGYVYLTWRIFDNILRIANLDLPSTIDPEIIIIPASDTLAIVFILTSHYLRKLYHLKNILNFKIPILSSRTYRSFCKK